VRHHLALGVSSIHVVAHGPRSENRILFDLARHSPLVVEDEYDGPFDPFEKRDRLNRLVRTFAGEWVVLLDSDEFLEVPYASLRRTVAVMRWLRADMLAAPLLQRHAANGRVEALAGADPFEAFPCGSVDLYARLGQPQAATSKYPLFLVGPGTALREGGNHHPPNGATGRSGAARRHASFQVAAHRAVAPELASRQCPPVSHESAGYRAFLEDHGWTLPVEGAFVVSRFRPAPARPAALRVLACVAASHRRRADPARSRPDAGRSRDPGRPRGRRGQGRRRHTCHPRRAGSGGAMFMAALRRAASRCRSSLDRDRERWNTRFDGVRVCALDEAAAWAARAHLQSARSPSRRRWRRRSATAAPSSEWSRGSSPSRTSLHPAHALCPPRSRSCPPRRLPARRAHPRRGRSP